MTKNTIFTICAGNYYGLAQVLKQSLLQHNPDTNFYVFIADGISEEERSRSEFGSDAIDAVASMATYVPAEKLREMTFKYDVTEYCTSIKPFCFRYLFDTTETHNAIYLDPDIFVFDSLVSVFQALETASIVLTPHIIFPSLFEGKRTDTDILSTGVFNLGFLALRRSATTVSMLSWWGERLFDQCFVDSHDSQFTDQKWMDFVPTLFPNSDVISLRYSGMNVAPWNFHERTIIATANGGFKVMRRAPISGCQDIASEERIVESLVFVHFSGFDYKKFCEGLVAHRYYNDGLNLYSDLNQLIELYMQAIEAQRHIVLQFLSKPYLYANFQNGTPILSFHRRLYRSAVESGMSFGDPFSIAENSFHESLRKNGLLPKSSRSISVERSNKFNLSGLNTKLAIINFLMRLTKKIIGLHNYMLLLRLMRPYSRAESQLHLIDPSQNKL